MKPRDAFARMAHREIERVEIDELEGRVTTVAADAVSAGHSAADSGRALQPARSSTTCSSRATSTSASRASTPTSTAWSRRDRRNGKMRYYADCVRQVAK